MFAACSFNFCLHVYRFTPTNGTMHWLLWLRRVCNMQHFHERNCCCTNISGLLLCASCVVECAACSTEHMKRFQIIFDILRKRAQRRIELQSKRTRIQAANVAAGCLSINVSSGHVQQSDCHTDACDETANAYNYFLWCVWCVCRYLNSYSFKSTAQRTNREIKSFMLAAWLPGWSHSYLWYNK